MHYQRSLGHGSIILIFLICIPLVLTGTAFAQGGGEGESEPCHECHGTDGDYTFEGLSVRSHTRRVIDLNEEFEHIIELAHPGEYDARSIKIDIQLDSATNIMLLEKNTKTLDLLKEGTTTVSFKMRSKEPIQSQKIRTVVTYWADYHYNATKYTQILDISVTIDRLMIQPSAWSIDIKTGDSETIEVKALYTVQNVVIIPSASLDDAVKLSHDIPDTVTKGSTFEIKLKGKNPGTGKLNIVYEDEDGVPHKATLDVQVTGSSEKRTQFWLPVGMVAGILSWVLLFLSVIVGTPVKRWKPALNKLFRNALIRKEVHCGICYILLFLALFHAVVVMSTFWYGTMLENTFVFADLARDYGLYINFGSVSWVLMIIISVTGIAFRPMARPSFPIHF